MSYLMDTLIKHVLHPLAIMCLAPRLHHHQPTCPGVPSTVFSIRSLNPVCCRWDFTVRKQPILDPPLITLLVGAFISSPSSEPGPIKTIRGKSDHFRLPGTGLGRCLQHTQTHVQTFGRSILLLSYRCPICVVFPGSWLLIDSPTAGLLFT